MGKKKDKSRKGMSNSTLDKLWSQVVKKRAGYKCEICGATEEMSKLEAHHFVSRSFRQLRWNPDNGVCLCKEHHNGPGHSAHRNPLWFIERMKLIRDGELGMGTWYYSLVHELELKDWKDCLPLIKNLLEKELQ